MSAAIKMENMQMSINTRMSNNIRVQSYYGILHIEEKESKKHTTKTWMNLTNNI